MEAEDGRTLPALNIHLPKTSVAIVDNPFPSRFLIPGFQHVLDLDGSCIAVAIAITTTIVVEYPDLSDGF